MLQLAPVMISTH